MTDLHHLLSKLEAAEGPAYALDLEIAALLSPESESIVSFQQRAAHIPAYTASLDAAVGLVPEGWSGGFEFGPTQNGVQFDANLWNGKFAPETCEVAAIAPTPALALCIAALKAREQQDNKTQGATND